jgi:oligopeptidase B
MTFHHVARPRVRLDRRALLFSTAAFALLGASGARSEAPAAGSRLTLPPAPITPRRPLRIEQLGRVRVDDYAWLHNPEWFTRLLHPDSLDPEIRAHILAENAYCKAVMAPSLPLQEELFQEMRRRTATAAEAPPEPDGPFAYSMRTEAGAQQPRFLRRPTSGGAEQVLLDADLEARGRAYYRLGSLKSPAHSPNHQFFAWAADTSGDEHFKLYLRDVGVGGLVFPPIENCYGEFVFSPDSRWIYWLFRDNHSLPTKVFRRSTAGGEDILVYEEHDPAYFISLSRTASNAYVLITISNESGSEIRLIPAADPAAVPRVVEARAPGLTYELEHWNDHFVVRTNADGADDFKLMTAPEAAPERKNWREWIPHRAGRFITAMRAFKGQFARIEWVNASPVLIVRTPDDVDHAVATDEAAYSLTLDLDCAYPSTGVRYCYQSPRTPPQWLAYGVSDGSRRLLGAETPANVDPKVYVVRRLFARAADGTAIPISLLMRADTRQDGSAPMIMFGYGCYGFSLEPEFSAQKLSLADRGWVVVIAHVRGGGEGGADWFKQVLTVHKKLTITDFITCADYLVAEGYSRPGRIVAHSFSAGGILIGGSINLRPDLWAGVIAQVPFVDVLNTMHDHDNPLVATAVPIWGDVSKPEVFDYIASYSPYENVRPQPYPAVYATAGLLDDRVGYWESAKWVAKLRADTTSGRPVMVDTNMVAGHQGDAGQLDGLRQTAMFYAFAVFAAEKRWG